MQDLVYRLRKRAEIRRQIPTRKSVQEGKSDKIADLLEEAADKIESLEKQNMVHFTNTKSSVNFPPVCIDCKQPFKWGVNIFTPAGLKETYISNTCEKCFDNLFGEFDE